MSHLLLAGSVPSELRPAQTQPPPRALRRLSRPPGVCAGSADPARTGRRCGHRPTPQSSSIEALRVRIVSLSLLSIACSPGPLARPRLFPVLVLAQRRGLGPARCGGSPGPGLSPKPATSSLAVSRRCRLLSFGSPCGLFSVSFESLGGACRVRRLGWVRRRRRRWRRPHAAGGGLAAVQEGGVVAAPGSRRHARGALADLGRWRRGGALRRGLGGARRRRLPLPHGGTQPSFVWHTRRLPRVGFPAAALPGARRRPAASLIAPAAGARRYHWPFFDGPFLMARS